MNIQQYWADVLHQDAEAIRTYFHPEARIHWNNTNECFTVEEFIRANCEYPNCWDGEIEQLLSAGDTVVTAIHVFTRDRKQFFHVTSFIRIIQDHIMSIEEYWGEDGDVPQWRRDMGIGSPIK